jgi:hypothetical protein
MSFPYSPKLQDTKVESLQTQYEYLKLLRLRHLQWKNSAEDRATADMHLEIAGLIEKITDRYSRMLETLRR